MLGVAVFAATYVGMAVGRVPGIGLDRSGIALIGAVVLVAAGSVPPDEVGDAIHFPTLLLLGGLMVISARMEGLGLYGAAGTWIAARAHRPVALLAAVVAGGGLLSAVLVNDDVVLASPHRKPRQSDRGRARDGRRGAAHLPRLRCRRASHNGRVDGGGFGMCSGHRRDGGVSRGTGCCGGRGADAAGRGTPRRRGSFTRHGKRAGVWTERRA